MRGRSDGTARDRTRRRAAFRSGVPALALALGLLVAAAGAPAQAAGYTYTGVWQGSTVSLTWISVNSPAALQAANSADSQRLGQLTDFQTNDPGASCLDGASFVVWGAPAELPGEDVAVYTAAGAGAASGSGSPGSGAGSTSGSCPAFYTLALIAGTAGTGSGTGSGAGSGTATGPTIGAIRPDAAPMGATVTITGSGFGPSYSGNDQITGVGFFGPNITLATSMASIVSWSDTQIVATVPWQGVSPGPAQVEVWNYNVSNAMSAAVPFTVSAGTGPTGHNALALTANPSTPAAGQATTLTATLADPANDGAISFSLAPQCATGQACPQFVVDLGSCTPAQGSCAVSWQAAAGTWVISASWPGDAQYDPAGGQLAIAVAGAAGGSSGGSGASGGSGGSGGSSGGSGASASRIVLQIGSTAAQVGGSAVAMPVAPVIEPPGRTFVPLRFVSQALGAQVRWDAATRQVTIVLGGHTVVMTEGGTTYTLDGSASRMDAAPFIQPPGYTMVPIRFVSQALGFQVSWNAAAQQVTIAAGGS